MRPAAPASAYVLTLNGGSSSIKFAVFACAGAPTRTVHGSIAGIGRSQGTITVAGSGPADALFRTLAIADHQEAVRLMVDWV
ncbi:MAG: acetate/propionate family kinase, partial [Planctomycetes bacterium]|nr:acetate/propionate family kinase [Planctomycetota bacterium]